VTAIAPLMPMAAITQGAPSFDPRKLDESELPEHQNPEVPQG